MKKIIVLLLIVCGCNAEPEYIQKKVIKQKTIFAKKEATVSDSKWKFNVWTGRSYPVAEIETIYLFIYTDGTSERVTVEEYVMKEKGDIISRSEIQWIKKNN